MQQRERSGLCLLRGSSLRLLTIALRFVHDPLIHIRSFKQRASHLLRPGATGSLSQLGNLRAITRDPPVSRFASGVSHAATSRRIEEPKGRQRSSALPATLNQRASR